MDNVGKYAIAGGNLEIIHICEQNHVVFYGSYEAAIEFHQVEVFLYLIENKIIKTIDIKSLGKHCILHNSYEILSYLLDKEGLQVGDSIIHELATTGNLFLIKCFPDEYQFASDTFVSAGISGNIELIEYFLKNKKVDVNVKNILKFNKE